MNKFAEQYLAEWYVEPYGTFVIKNCREYDGPGVYIGRGSPLGNPYPICGLVTREYAITLYYVWLRDTYKRDNMVRKAINDLLSRYIRGEEIVLICYCAPKSCHGDEIARFVKELAEKWKKKGVRP
jgi:hypothetical protein